MEITFCQIVFQVFRRKTIKTSKALSTNLFIFVTPQFLILRAGICVSHCVRETL